MRGRDEKVKWKIISSQSAIVPRGIFSIGVLYYIKGVLHVRYPGEKEKLHRVAYSPGFFGPCV